MCSSRHLDSELALDQLVLSTSERGSADAYRKSPVLFLSTPSALWFNIVCMTLVHNECQYYFEKYFRKSVNVNQQYIWIVHSKFMLIMSEVVFISLLSITCQLLSRICGLWHLIFFRRDRRKTRARDARGEQASRGRPLQIFLIDADFQPKRRLML